MNATVVVLSQRPGDWLAPCLRSVTDQADEVVLVDNASPSSVASEIGREAGVRVLRSERNLGYAGGVNLGLAQARGDLVGLLNDDAVAGPGWLQRAADVLAVADVAAVTPKVLRQGWYREVVLDDPPWPAPSDDRALGRQLRSVSSDGVEVLERLVGVGIHRLENGQDGDHWRWTVPHRPFYVPVTGAASEVTIDGDTAGDRPVCRLLNKAGSYLRVNGVLGDHGDESPDDGRWDRPAERFFASGTALVARRETFARIGNMAEPFFAYCEDGDWSWRARLAGMRLLYDPGAVVEHRVSATSETQGEAWRQRLAARNRVLCLVRNAPASVALGGLRRVARVGPDAGVRRQVLTRLPWALRSRRQLSAGWTVAPSQVWDRWAGADTTWDDGPAGSTHPRRADIRPD